MVVGGGGYSDWGGRIRSGREGEKAAGNGDGSRFQILVSPSPARVHGEARLVQAWEFHLLSFTSTSIITQEIVRNSSY